MSLFNTCIRMNFSSRKYFFDDNPFDALNLGILLFEGQDSVCADFFKRIDEEEREETEESRRVAAASSYRLLVLEEERGDFYRNLPDAEKYILSKKKYLERTIEINKEQVDSLNENKKTLKMFMIGGT